MNHAEAFCLMQYASKDGRTREVLWNSRDGVTPFVIWSHDGVEMCHVNWGGDRFAPGYVPAVGDRVFVDATIEDFTESKARMVEAWWESPDFAHIRERYSSKREAILDLAKRDFDEHPGGPKLVEVTPEMRAMFERTRDERWEAARRAGRIVPSGRFA